MRQGAALHLEYEPEQLSAARIQHSAPSIGDDEVEAVARVLRSGQVAQGREVEAFEAEMSAFAGRKYGVAVHSGLAGLHLAIAALGVKRVAMPSYACSALPSAIHHAGGFPVLCDVDSEGQLDPGAIPSRVDAAIVPHLFGATARVPREHVAIEDIAQSLGGGTGRKGIAAVASFYATKLMTTGEGGMVLMDDEGLAESVRDMRDYDNRDDYQPRFNYKTTDIQAAMGRAQLRRLPGFIARRREIAAQYDAAFAKLPLSLPRRDGHVYFRYVVRTKVRGALESYLNAEAIEAKRPIYKPAHRYFAAPEGKYRVALAGLYRGTDAMYETALSLPIHPSMLDDEVRRVAESVRRFFG